MIPVAYSYRSLFVRWKTTLMTAAAFTLVIAALIVMLAFVNGIQEICRTSGDPLNVIVLNEGSNDEVLSRIPRVVASQIATSAGVVRDGDNQAVVSPEVFLAALYYDKNASDYVGMSMRGVTPRAYSVHPEVTMSRGRAFRPSQSEVIVGENLARSRKLELFDELEIGRKKWRVCGFFSAGGSAFESEIWCDLDELAGQFKREGTYSTLVLRAISPEVAQSLAQALDSSRQFSVSASTEVDYYAKQGESTKVIQAASWGIAFIMGGGAIFGVMNTMFAAIAQRIKDIAVLRLLGFMPWEILIAFLLESILIALVGGFLGVLIGYSANGLTQNWSLGSHEVQFAFRVDASILSAALIFSGVMGALGGIFPALSAMRVKPIEAFR